LSSLQTILVFSSKLVKKKNIFLKKYNCFDKVSIEDGMQKCCFSAKIYSVNPIYQLQKEIIDLLTMLRKILFVDEDISIGEDFQSAFSKEIAMELYSIILCQSGEEALKIIEKSDDLDLLITDLYFRDAVLGGWELIKVLRDQDIMIKTIILASYVSYESRIKALKENVVTILEKPVLFADLKVYINFLLNLPEPVQIELNPLDLKNYKSILEAANKLNQQIKVRLINKLLKSLNFNHLKKIEIQKNLDIQEKIAEDKKQEDLKKQQLKNKFLEKYRQGKIKIDLDLEEIDNFSISKKYVNNAGPYYTIHYWQKGKTKNIYLGRDVFGIDEED
jgi:CheY-like chemotaxis protein